MAWVGALTDQPWDLRTPDRARAQKAGGASRVWARSFLDCISGCQGRESPRVTWRPGQRGPQSWFPGLQPLGCLLGVKARGSGAGLWGVEGSLAPCLAGLLVMPTPTPRADVPRSCASPWMC